MYLYGKNSVLERLKVNPKSIRKVFLQHNFDTTHIINLIESKNIPFERISEKRLNRVKRADRIQGVVAEVDEFIYTTFEELLNMIPSPYPLPKGERDKVRGKLSLICLDNINDPHNFGSIMRSAACFGNFGIVIPSHRSCEVNETVVHVASGGENFVPVSMVNNMSNALIKAKKAGYWIVGTVVERGEDIDSVKLPFPLCLVMGSEGKGIRHGVEKQLDLKVMLPMKGATLSLNVAMACAIFCYRIAYERDSKKAA